MTVVVLLICAGAIVVIGMAVAIGRHSHTNPYVWLDDDDA